MKSVAKSKKYKINMSIWHKVNYDWGREQCEVCLSGAVMAKTFREDPKKTILNLNKYNKKTRAKLLFLDSVRLGIITVVLKELKKGKVISHSEYKKANEWFMGDEMIGLPNNINYYGQQHWNHKQNTAHTRKQFDDYMMTLSDLFKAINL